MREILKEDTHVGEGFRQHEPLIHVPIERELLYDAITTDRRGRLSPTLVTVPDGLHYVEDREDRTAQSPELPAGCAARLGISGR